MKLFVTGARRVHRVELRALGARQHRSPVTVFDKLTYAGNLATSIDVLAAIAAGSSRATSATRPPCSSTCPGHDAVVHFAAESHVDRSIVDPYAFVHTNVFGTNVLCDVARRVGVERFLHISTDEVYGSIEDRLVHRARPSHAALAVLGDEGRLRPRRAQLLHHLRPAGRGDALLEQLRAVPVPREADPAVHHQPARRQARCR